MYTQNTTPAMTMQYLCQHISWHNIYTVKDYTVVSCFPIYAHPLVSVYFLYFPSFTSIKWHLFTSCAVLFFMHNIKNYVQSSWPLITLEHKVKFVIWSKLAYLIIRRKLVYVDFNKQRGRLMSQIWKQSDFKSYSNKTSHHTLNKENQFDVNERRGKFYELNIKIIGKKLYLSRKVSRHYIIRNSTDNGKKKALLMETSSPYAWTFI